MLIIDTLFFYPHLGKEVHLISKTVSNKIKYHLYIYNKIDKMIKEIETDIIESSSVTVNTWLRGKHCFTNTMENQAISIASCKQLKSYCTLC